MMSRTKLWVTVVAGVCFVLQAGCQIDYFAHLVVGELVSLGSTVPIAEALNDSRLTEEELVKLELTQQVRQFGIDRIGLFVGEAYTLFEANGSEPAAYVLSASARDSFTPYWWDFPSPSTSAWLSGPGHTPPASSTLRALACHR